MDVTSAGPVSAVKPRRRWWQRALSLRGLMVLVLVVGGGIGWWVRQATERRAAIAVIRATGGSVAFADEMTTNPGGWWTQLYRWTGVAECREIFWVGLGKRPGIPAPDPDPAVIDSAIEAVGRLGPVRTFAMDGWPITGTRLAAIESAPIEEIRFSEVSALPDDALAELARCRRVRSLMIVMRRAQLPRGILRAVGNLPQLESLMLYRWFPALSAGDLAPLGRLRNLKTLDLNWARLDESTLGELDPLDRLETLDLSSTQVTDATLGRLVARHPRLTSLRLDGRLLTDEGLAVLTQLPRLSRLRLGGDFGAVGQLTDVGLATLARIATLRDLNVTCGRFTTAGLDALRPLPLDNLGLGAIQPGSEAALARLVAGRSYGRLVLNGPGVTDAVLPHLAGSLGPRSILDLTRSGITDAGMPDLAPLPILAVVLNQTALSDAGLATFTAGMTPRELMALGTRITPAGAAAFEAALPDRGAFTGTLGDEE